MAEIRELVLTFLERLSHNALPKNRKRETLDACIVYNVDNNLDEVLLAIVYTVYPGNIITRSRLVVKVTVTSVFVTLCSSVLVQRKAGSHPEGSQRSVSRTPASLVEECCFQ